MTAGGRRRHSWLVRVFFFTGAFLLVFAAGTFSSAIFLSHKEDVALKEWTQATASVRNCKLYADDPLIRIGKSKLYSVLCQVRYSFAGHPYDDVIFSNYSRSEKRRSAIAGWIARNSPETELVLRVNPKDPVEFFVQSPLPFHHHDDPQDFTYAAFGFVAAGLVLIWIGKMLLRAGL